MSVLIYKAINEIMKELPAISKDRKLEHNGRLQYKFRGIDDVYMALNPLLVKHKVTTVPFATVHTAERVATKNGEANRVILNVTYTFYAEDGSNVQAQAIGEGMDTGDKAANKAMSAAHKYALLQVFCIPTEEPKDSENDHHEIESKSRDVEKKTNGVKTVVTGTSPVNVTNQSTGDYVMTFGKYKDRTVKELIEVHSQPKIMSYISWLQADARDKKKPMNQAATDFIDAFNAFIGISELDQALEATTKETFDEKMKRLKNSFPGIPGPKHSLPYKDDEPPWDPNESFPENFR